MAPYIPAEIISDLSVSSLELDAQSTTTDPLSNAFSKRDDSMSPAEVFNTLTARDETTTRRPDYSGSVDPNDINMKGIQALFAIIGALFVLAIIWFFFWAKNGGFQWRKGDWDDYKSTVLRRKGPNGTTLSNATKSTRLGGGSVVGEGYSDGDASTVITGTMTDTMTELSSQAPILQEKKKRKETAKDRKIREGKEAQWEGGHDHDVRAYRHERPARVGGINRDSDALHYGTDYTDTESSVLNTHRSGHQSRTSTPTPMVQQHRQQPQQQQQPQQPQPQTQTQTHPPPPQPQQQQHYQPQSYPQQQRQPVRQPSPEKRSSRRDFSYGQDAAFSTVSASEPEQSVPVASYTPQPPLHRPGRYHSPSKQYGGASDARDQRRSAQYSHQQPAPGYT